MIRIAGRGRRGILCKSTDRYLNEYQKTEKEELDITVYRDGDAVTAEYKSQFDIILMDIQMKFVDGMTAAEEIRKMDSEVVIIFITNMTQYAIRGYEVDALDYVLKPVSYFAFSQKLKRAVSRIKKRSSKYITLAVKGGVIRVDLDDIYYVESAGHNLLYHMGKCDAFDVRHDEIGGGTACRVWIFPGEYLLSHQSGTCGWDSG